MSLNNKNRLTLDHPDYESGGQGVILFTLTAALTILLIIISRLFKQRTNR